jgi:YcxB-like protein
MEIVYRVSEKDYIAAHDLYVANEKPIRRWSRRLLPWEGAFIIFLALTLVIFARDWEAGMFLCLIGIFCIYYAFALRRYFTKRYRTDQRFKQEFKLQVSENGLHFMSPSVESQSDWRAAVRYLESDDIFMLFSAPMIFAVIPKRAFSPGDADAFRDLLARNVQAPR